MDHLAYVAGQPEDISNGQRGRGGLHSGHPGREPRRRAADGDDLLLAAQQRLLKKK